VANNGRVGRAPVSAVTPAWSRGWKAVGIAAGATRRPSCGDSVALSPPTWIIPEGAQMPIPSRLSAAAARPAEQGQLIVARDHVALCQALQEPFAARGTFTVVVDRRRADRRQRVQAVLKDRRRRDRRSAPSVADDLRLWPYVLVRPYYRRPHD
jgi:hypothetical protein